MANEQNLRPWPKGVSGNPAGHSRGRRAVDHLLDLIADRDADGKIAEMWLKEILAGEFKFFETYLARRDGPAQTVDAQGQAADDDIAGLREHLNKTRRSRKAR